MRLEVNLFCTAPEPLMRFYAALLGLQGAEGPSSPIYRSLLIGEGELGFNARDAYAVLGLTGREAGAGAGPVRAYPTFGVDDAATVDRAAARVDALGGRVLRAPYRTYYGAWQTVLEDPEGNVFRVHVPRPAAVGGHLPP